MTNLLSNTSYKLETEKAKSDKLFKQMIYMNDLLRMSTKKEEEITPSKETTSNLERKLIRENLQMQAEIKYMLDLLCIEIEHSKSDKIQYILKEKTNERLRKDM